MSIFLGVRPAPSFFEREVKSPAWADVPMALVFSIYPPEADQIKLPVHDPTNA